jgi:hypothetical protein
MSTFRIIGQADPLDDHFSESIEVEIDGKRYLRETWFTHNSGGVEWYEADNLAWVVSPDGDDEEIDALLDEIDAEADRLKTKYDALFDALVAPVIKQIKEEVYGPCE